MDQQFLDILATQGIFVALFVWLFWDTRKDSKQREEKYQETINKYQETINKLAEQAGINKEVKEDVEEIKKDVIEIKNKLNK